MTKKLVSLILALAMLLSAAALADIPDYINLESERPIVKDGQNVPLKLVSTQADAYPSKPEDVWLWEFMRQKMNLNLEVEQVLASAASERLNLMMVSDELPDILIGFNLNTADLIRYGQVEGQLLDIKPYLSEELTPNMCKMFEYFPNVLPMITAPDGGIYSVFSYGTDAMPRPRTYVYQSWLDEKGIESPKTLDELTELLRAFRAENPDSTPLGGSENANDPRAYILNAIGFLTDNPIGLNPAFKNGEVVIPAADGLYLEFLKVMKTYYDESLISADFFTLDSTAVNAQMAEGKNVVSCIGAPYLALPEAEDFQQWWAAYPLTSATNDTAAYMSGNYVTVGGMVFSAKTEYPEVLLRLADYFFGDEGGNYKWSGPMAGTEDTLGMISGWVFNEEGTATDILDAMNGKYPSAYAAICSTIAPWGGSESFGYRNSIDDPSMSSTAIMQGMAGLPQVGKIYSKDNGDHFYRMGLEEIAYPRQNAGYPAITWFTEDESLVMNEIKTIVEPYIKSETAKFITGVRSLDEFDQYIEELKGMDIETLLGYYVSAYEAFKANANA